jgi:LysM repeat protein
MPERGIRFWAARVLAPLAFFAAATLLVLVVRDSFDDEPATVVQVITNEAGEEVTITTVLGETETSGTGTTETGPETTETGDTSTDAEPRARPRTYRIRRGDTLEGIAARFDVTLEDLLAANADTNLDAVQLQTGQRIRIPQGD